MTQPSAGDPRQLAAALDADDADRRAEAAERLAQSAEAAAEAVIPLVRACGDADERVREWAVAALEDLGPPPGDSIGDLIPLVGDERPLVGYWAATILGRSGQDGAAAVPALAERLAKPGDSSVRQRAAWALGQIGPAAKAAEEPLRRAAGEGDERLARLASEALAAIDG